MSRDDSDSTKKKKSAEVNLPKLRGVTWKMSSDTSYIDPWINRDSDMGRGKLTLGDGPILLDMINRSMC